MTFVEKSSALAFFEKPCIILNMSKVYKIPVTWSCWGTMKIEAENLEQALELAQEKELPTGHYLDDSFEVDEDLIEECEL